LLDTSLPGNGNAGHEFRNLTLEEFESLAPEQASTLSRSGGSDLDRWSAVLGAPADELGKKSDAEMWDIVRAKTREILRSPGVKRDHPFKGVIGPELAEDERLDLVEYLKSL